MNSWLMLALSISAELFGTVCLKLSATSGNLWWSAGILCGYLLAFWGLENAVKTLPLGLAYAMWAGCGVVGSAILGRLLFAEIISPARLFGLALVVCGVVVLGLTGKGH